MARKPTPSASHLFPKRKDSDAVTSERIADDLAAFRKAGGRIEVLGVTQVLKNLAGPTPVVAPAATAARPASKQRKETRASS